MTASRRRILSVAVAIVSAMAVFVARGTPAPAADIRSRPASATASTATSTVTISFRSGIRATTKSRCCQVRRRKASRAACWSRPCRSATWSIHVVRSPGSATADEPDGHASPIAQTNYFYDATVQRWMVAHPEGTDGGGPPPPPAAAVFNETTIGGRADAAGQRPLRRPAVIPLSTTLFVVVKDGGGSAFTDQVARTVAPLDAHIDSAALKAALHDLAVAYEKQLQQIISPSTLCALSGTCGR